MEQMKPLIDQLVKMIQDGSDFVGGQLPDVAKQILAYNAWSAHFWMWVFITFALISVVLFIAACLSIGAEPVCALAIIGLVVSLAGVGFNYSDLKEIQIAPKLYLIETLRKTLR